MIITRVIKYGLTIEYSVSPIYRGFSVEGQVPCVPEDDAPGWVYFDLANDGTVNGFFDTARELARMLFCDLGFTSDQVISLMEDF